MTHLNTGTSAQLPSGITVGNATLVAEGTGCTVILCPQGAVASVAVRGGAPATRETDLLKPHNTVQEIHALVLSGGSAFGLDAASGVMRFLEEQGTGFPFGGTVVPIVVGASLFDLSVGDATVRPNAALGAQAAAAAVPFVAQTGSVGAGTGASVGHFLGVEGAMKGGLGAASVQSDELIVCALVAVNSLGSIYSRAQGGWLAGACVTEDTGVRRIVDPLEVLPLAFATQAAQTAQAAQAAQATQAAQTTQVAQAAQAAKTEQAAQTAQEAAQSAQEDAQRAPHTKDAQRAKSAKSAEDEESPEGLAGSGSGLQPGTNTTIGAILTNARLSKTDAYRVASVAHDGMARAIYPVHTSFDGDALFTLATGEHACSADMVAVLAAEAVEQAIINAVCSATSAYGLPSASDLKTANGLKAAVVPQTTSDPRITDGPRRADDLQLTNEALIACEPKAANEALLVNDQKTAQDPV